MSCGYGSVDAEDIQKAAKLVGLSIKSHSKAKKLAGALIREDVPLPDDLYALAVAAHRPQGKWL